MKKLLMLALLCVLTQATWAQTWTEVSTYEALTAAITDGANIRLMGDITLSAHLRIGQSSNQTVTIDLNGHTLRRNLSSASSDGHVIEVYDKGTLTVTDGATGGTITGGWANNGGGICNYGTLYFQGGTITGCKTAYESGCMGGGIKNNKGGTVTMSGGTITRCESGDCGGIYNGEGATLNVTGGTISDCKSGAGGGGIVNYGTATLSGLTLTGNTAGTRGGNIWNNGSLTIDDCDIKDGQSIIEAGGLYLNGGTATLTNVKVNDNESKDGGGFFVTSGATLNLGGSNQITGNKSTEHGGGGITNYGTLNISGILDMARNTCHTNGGGIWNNGTLSMTGDDLELVVKDNRLESGKEQNIFLKSGKKINVTGEFGNKTQIGITMESAIGTFTSGYSTRNGTRYGYFFSDQQGMDVVIDIDTSNAAYEAKLVMQSTFTYYECSWDEATNTVTKTQKTTSGRVNVIKPGSYASGAGLKSSDWDYFVIAGTVTISNGLTIEGDCKFILLDGAELIVEGGVGNGIRITNKSTLRIYGQENGTGKLKITGKKGTDYAPIGPYDKDNSINLEIHGGDIETQGAEDCPGINIAKESTFTMYDGTVTARGGKYGAGIGGNEQDDVDPRCDCGKVIIHGGTVHAYGGAYGAGIGGGQGGEGGDIHVTGGYVYADGGLDGAGIGTGEGSWSDLVVRKGGEIHITGGKVVAEGTGWGAGIGGGEYCSGADVYIYGGTLIASAGSDAASKNGSAIGSEDGDGRGKTYGTIEFGDDMMVHAGQDAADAANHLFTAEERLSACRWRAYAIIEHCKHENATYIINGTGENDTHTLKCPSCLVQTESAHTYKDGICTVCGARGTAFTINIYLPDLNTATKYTKAESYTVKAGTINLPVPPAANTPEGMEFAGWLVGEPTGLTSWESAEGEELKAVGAEYTVGAPVSLTARYKKIEVRLANAASNEETIYKYKGKNAYSVTLSGRTLYKDGKWNTLVLPFSLSSFRGTPLEGGTVKALNGSSYNSSTGTLTLNFASVTDGMEAGYPFLIKWEPSDEHIVNPVFENVTIDASLYVSITDYIDFVGIYSPEMIYQGMDTERGDEEDKDKTNLYLGSDNKLFTPSTAGFTVNSCRGYFRLKNGLKAGTLSNDVREFTLNFEGETTGISEIENCKSKTENYFNLNGQRVSKPAKGLYIYKGKKVIIK